MKKRVLLVVAAMSLLVAVGLTGCGGTTVADPNAASSAAAPTTSMALSEVSEDNLNGMITYLKGNGVIKEATTDMKAEMIGAVSGKMVQAIYGDSVALVEIYEFDKDNLNESAQEVIQNAKENGKFKSMDGELTATLSNNEKYLMIYKDVYTDDTNRPIQERLLTLFKEFEPTGTSSSADNSASSTENSSESQDQENNSTSSATAESAAQEENSSNNKSKLTELAFFIPHLIVWIMHQ